MPNTVDTITAGQIYYFKVWAVNSRGNGEFSQITSVAAASLPVAPTNLHKNTQLSSETWITVSWDSVAPVNPVGGNIRGYKLYIYNSSVSDFIEIFNGESLGLPSQTQYSITNVTPGQ